MADIERFDNIVEAIKHLEPNHILGQCLEREGMAVKHSMLHLITMPDGTIAALSFPVDSTFYRGENGCFSSCKASLYRIKKRDDRILALLKSYDFILFLYSLPEVQEYVLGGGYYAPWALAQHYEFATPMIDLTSELAVAAFFSTHYYDRITKQYQLMKEGIGRIRGVIGFMDSEAMPTPLKPIGKQPFARPDRQDGFAWWIPENEDFADQSFCVEFVQDYKVNLRLKTAVMGGSDYYFPSEQVVQMASIIKNTNAITRTAIGAMLKDILDEKSYITPDVTEEDIDRVITEKNVYVVDAPVICPEAMPHQMNSFMEDRGLIVRPAYRKQ